MSTPQQQVVHSEGILHGLPTYDASVTGLTAIIAGANGISGQHMARALAGAPHRWARIFCLSRRAPAAPLAAPHVTHIAVDLQQPAADIAAALLRQAQHDDGAGLAAVDHVFFYAYAEPAGAARREDAAQLVALNTPLLRNLLGALGALGAAPRRVLLQTGAKNYGVHLGPTRVPQRESDARVAAEPSFYYTQEDALREWCAAGAAGAAGCSWNVSMPGPILGAVAEAAMNVAYTLGVYAAVSAEMRAAGAGDGVLAFPGGVRAFRQPQSMSSAALNARMAEWIVLAAPAGARFNTCDGCAFTWEGLWARLAGWYGLRAGVPGDDDGDDGEALPVSRARKVVRVGEWFARAAVRAAWDGLVARHGLRAMRAPEEQFAFLDACLARNAALHMSMDKSRKLGWHGYVDSCESLLQVLDELAALKMLPPVPRVEVRFD